MRISLPLVVVLATAPVSGAGLSDYTAAAANDTFVEIQLEHKTVGDTVGYSPNLPEGGQAAPQEHRRFDENSVQFSFHRGQKLSLTASIGQRQFTSLRDNFEFNVFGGGLRYQFHAGSDSSTALVFDYNSNRVSQLNKNSYTTIDNQVIKSVAINSPSDSQWNLGFKHLKAFGNSLQLNVHGSIGKTNTGHDGLSGLLTRGNCNYSFDFGAAGGTIDQIGTCGTLTALSRTYPDDSTVQQEFGVSPVQDLQNRSTFLRAGAGISKNFNRWSITADYYYQQYFREALDDRILLAGGNVYDSNHTFSTSAGFQLTRDLTITAKAEYHQHRYLDQVPVLYTRLTSGRFEDDAVFFSLNLNYRFSL